MIKKSDTSMLSGSHDVATDLLQSVVAAGSPCVDICELDSDFVCIGCGRTIDEVLKWTQYTDEQKKAVLDRIFGEK